MQDIHNTPWHSLTLEEVFKRLNARSKGLDEQGVQERLDQFGPNQLEENGKTHWLGMLLRQLRSPLIYILGIASAIAFFSGHRIDSFVILGVVILNTIIGFVQEWRAERALEELRQLSAPHAKVRRNGTIAEISASEVVPGDVLILDTGARVAADARILQAHDLYVNESALTGESEAVLKQPGKFTESEPMADRTNMVWMSTPVTAGRGEAVVVATGKNTAIGEIATSVREMERERTPLQKRLDRLGTGLGIIVVIFAIIIFVIGLLRGYDVITMIMYAIATAVSALPEGLPAVISIVLALGVRRMAENKAIVRSLPAVETLGSTTVICSDKTGTITRNEMTVTHLWAGGRTYKVSDDGYDLQGEIAPEDNTEERDDSIELRLLLTAGILANDAKKIEHADNHNITGTPTEAAILISGMKGGLNPQLLRSQHTRKDEIPFSSDKKYMATLHTNEEGSIVYLKGAPERVIDFCSHVMLNGNHTKMTEGLRQQVHAANQSFAERALRVVAAAYKEVPAETAKIEEASLQENLTFLGLWGMVDPPRPEAMEAIRKAKNAGIKIVMITGDHAVTATAIAEQVGILSHGKKAATGQDVDRMSKEELGKFALESGVFARVSPAHKLKIMEALKDRAQIVAMTGDGVNDAPALKGSDIGIAMGRSGTEVAKEAADLILADDNFATIVTAIEEGRVIFGNLRRAVFFLITTNGGEIIILTSAILLGFELPMTAVMILWINLVTDGVCDVPLGLEPKHEDVLQHPPRPVESGILDRVLIGRILLLAPLMAGGTLGLFYYELRTGTYAHAQTIAFTTLAAFQWFHAMNARSTTTSFFKLGFFSNKWLALGIGTAIILQIGVVYTDIGQKLLGTTPLSLFDWILIIAVASTILIAGELLKFFSRYGKT